LGNCCVNVVPVAASVKTKLGNADQQKIESVSAQALDLLECEADRPRNKRIGEMSIIPPHRLDTRGSG